jgi:hypothetical protein
MQGFLRKMSVTVPEGGCDADNPVEYALRLGDESYPLNSHIGATITITHTGNIECLHCGRATKKSFSQGYCYPCFKKLAQCDLCIMSPERCHYDKGTCRDDEFAVSHCMQPHIVYLANSSGIKVGITRLENIPSRWVDQGAIQAMPVLSVQTRQQSGFAEVAFKNFVSDKTRWQAMLKSDDHHIDMLSERDRLMAEVKPELDKVIHQFGIQAIQPIDNAEVLELTYPVMRYPEKVSSFNLDKSPVISGTLMGIKGQYLILDSGVINLRRFTSYEISVDLGESGAGEEGQLSLL